MIQVTKIRKNIMVHENVIEYITRDLFKGKSLKASINFFLKKFNGCENMYLGGKVNYSFDELYNAVLVDKAQTAIKNSLKLKDGMGYVALLGAAQQFNIPLLELRKAVIAIIGENYNNNILGD